MNGGLQKLPELSSMSRRGQRYLYLSGWHRCFQRLHFKQRTSRDSNDITHQGAHQRSRVQWLCSRQWVADPAAFTAAHRTAFAKAIADTLRSGITHDQVTATVGFARLRERARRLASLPPLTSLTPSRASPQTRPCRLPLKLMPFHQLHFSPHSRSE